jgi:hypothetical protein
MTTVVEFRLRRNEADAACARPHSAASSPSAGDPQPLVAEIILMPLAWSKRLDRNSPRKPLRRRFALRDCASAIACGGVPGPQ